MSFLSEDLKGIKVFQIPHHFIIKNVVNVDFK